MRLYWTGHSGRCLNWGISRQMSGGEVLRRARATPVWIGMIARAAFWGLLLGAVTGTLLRTAGVSIAIACASVAIVMATVVEHQVQFISQRAAMRREIMQSRRSERVPVCLKCGYDQSAMRLINALSTARRYARAPRTNRWGLA